MNCNPVQYHLHAVSCRFAPRPTGNMPADKKIEVIIDTVCKYFCIRPYQLKIKTRKKEIALARHMSIFYIRQKDPNITVKAIGRIFGIDHSTVIYAIEKISEQTNPKFKNTVILEADAHLKKYLSWVSVSPKKGVSAKVVFNLGEKEYF